MSSGEAEEWMGADPSVEGEAKVVCEVLDDEQAVNSLLTERIQEWWAEQEELWQNDEKPCPKPLRLASPKVEKVANSPLASLVQQSLVVRLLKRVKELPLTRSVAYVLRQVSDLRLSLPVHYPVDWNEKAPGSAHYEGEF